MNTVVYKEDRSSKKREKGEIMKTRILAATIPMLFVATSVGAADKGVDFGKREYLNSCAVCHGTDGKAQTQVMDILKAAPQDLTKLAKRNGGVFPMARVYDVIDGRADVKAHGPRDMPIWGQRFSADAVPGHDDFPYNTEVHVRARILGLIDYIYRIQEK